jgi:hypothetical protein
MHEFVVSELARLRIDDLVREGCRLRRSRRADQPSSPTAGRIGCLPVEGQA